jgi:hypothetical protein
VWSYAAVEGLWERICDFNPDSFRRTVRELTELLREAHLDPGTVSNDACQQLSVTTWATGDVPIDQVEAIAVLASGDTV